MAKPTRQQVSEQLNQLQSQGASEEQIAAAVTKAGYTLDDFNVSLDGKFEPFVIKAATGVPSSTPQEFGQTQQEYDESLASSSSVTGKPLKSTVTGTVTESSEFQQSTGGGTTTRYSTPSTPTAESQVYANQAQQAYNLAEAYRLNPNTPLGKSSLDRRLADGTITQAQYDEIKNSTREERLKKSGEYSAQYEQARDKEISALGPGTSTVEVTPAYNSSEVSTDYQEIESDADTTKVSGAIPGSNVTTETVDGTEYQVVNNGDGTASYTVANDPYGDTSVTVTLPATPDNIEPEPVDAEYNDSGELVDLNTGQVYAIDPESGFVEDSTGLLRSPEDIEAEYDSEGKLVDLNTGQVYNIDEESGFVETEGGFLVSPEDIVDDPYYSEDEEEPLTEFTVGPDAPFAQGSSKGLPGATQNTQAQATIQDTANFQAKADWRVRLSLSPGADYLYKASPVAGILQPLQATDGVIFPYTPQIQVQYSAGYEPTTLTHSNYKIFQYNGSSVDSISITCDFTAQDTQEANYLLAVIHFFRSATKMFYGQDNGPKPGTPPPLCYLSGLGAYQFDAHPLAITGFTYSLPNDVDYIRADIVTGASLPGVNTASSNFPNNAGLSASQQRLTQGGSNITVGGGPAPTQFPAASNPGGTKEPTYVPTKIQITVSAIPIISRNQISNDFSLKEYAKGTLLRGSKRSKPGVW